MQKQNKTKVKYLGFDDWNAYLYICCVCDYTMCISINDKLRLNKDRCPNCDRIITEVK